jgi:hypothetical protein
MESGFEVHISLRLLHLKSIEGVIDFSQKSVMMAQSHITVCDVLWSAKRKMKEVNKHANPAMSTQYFLIAPEMASLNDLSLETVVIRERMSF